ncbi:MAG: PadR family transcriptional regulator [Bacteroidales bacterium]|nr:PadR family transcriptional regulator [Bacteroidales bacterium]
MEKDIDQIRPQMRKGMLEYCILLILSKREAYVSSIIESLRKGGMDVVEGTLYPLLIRLKNQGWLDCRWEESKLGPPRKYYVITAEGRAMLAQLDSVWNEIESTVKNLKDPNSL